MKYFLTVLVFVAFSAHALITDPMSNQLAADGSVFKQEAVYINVKSASAVVQGDVYAFDTTADDGITVMAVAAEGDSAACIAAQASAANKLFKCQVYGFANFVNFDPSGGGEAAVAGSAGYASLVPNKVTGVSSPSAVDYPVGIFLDASSTTGDIDFFIKLL